MHLPFRQSQSLLPSHTLLIRKTRHAKPRCMSIVFGPGRGGDDVLDDLAARAGGSYFGIGAEAADEGQPRELGGPVCCEAASEEGRRGGERCAGCFAERGEEECHVLMVRRGEMVALVLEDCERRLDGAGRYLQELRSLPAFRFEELAE
jgi:hypothetical protein